ncbi:Hypothetical predicted protein [Olea europaea subsp. europaea]|uniref:Uncharacterized protein n=1 Tax=Olea europaea subsp. europaea TaxID=158383 RepID=A0A8S0SDQ1_OLEEU|nr:Hypothetical predicted protein [Olea europaea subsp. europaea]
MENHVKMTLSCEWMETVLHCMVFTVVPICVLECSDAQRLRPEMWRLSRIIEWKPCYRHFEFVFLFMLTSCGLHSSVLLLWTLSDEMLCVMVFELLAC